MTRYKGIWKNISEATRHQILKQMGYSSTRPHCKHLFSVKSRKLKLQFAQAHKNSKNGLMSLHFCPDIQLVGSEFVIISKARIHSAVYHSTPLRQDVILFFLSLTLILNPEVTVLLRLLHPKCGTAFFSQSVQLIL